MNIKFRDKKIIEKFNEIKEVENIKCNTKAFKRLLEIYDIHYHILKENEKLKQKKAVTDIL